MLRIPITINQIKVALITLSAAFFIPSCSLTPTPQKPKNTTPHILSKPLTHSLLKKWTANNYQNLPNHTITHKTHHPLAKKSPFTLTSGRSISPLTSPTKGIGLPCLIKTSTHPEHNFTSITKDAFQSNLHPANIVATQSRINGKITTHIDIYDPRHSTHHTPPYHLPLAHQPNIVIDHLYNLPGNSSLNIKGLIKPQKYSNYRGFYLAEPYNKNKIPIVMIHGLASSPEKFMDLSEAINTSPKLRKKYQLWYYFYPTGTPWIATASKFRSAFRNLIKTLDPHKKHHNINKTILIGHSMGGLIARASLSHPKQILHQTYLGNTPIQSIFNKHEIKKINDYFHYKPLTEPAKVIYLATPHRGSKIAEGIIGWATIKLITIPTFILQQTAEALTPKITARNKLPEKIRKLLNNSQSSITQLQPKNPSLIALNKMQIRKKLTSHSIIGDIGLPIFQLNTDGVVSYHSAHNPHSKSEHIIPSNHDISDHKKTIQTILNILHQ